MKIYSHVITGADVYRTLRQTVPGAYTDDRGVRKFRPRAGGNGFELFLALTWDEYGLWFAELFKLDPAARISWWKGVVDFVEGTQRDAERHRAPGEAPWLTDEDLRVVYRLEKLRASLRSENISYGELAELQSLAGHIRPGDVELLEAAGVPEFAGL